MEEIKKDDSDFKVEVVEVEEIVKHPNADLLDLARIRGWWCVVAKDKFKVGDKAVYFPVDSILPQNLVDIFFANSKIKPIKNRIRAIRIRKVESYGLLIHINEIEGIKDNLKVGTDLTKKLKVEKYEEPEISISLGIGRKKFREYENPNFDTYTSIKRIENLVKVFKEEDIISATEKIHGTNFRAGWVRYHVYTFWDRIKKFLGFIPKWEFVYGSHRVQVHTRKNSGFYQKTLGLDVYKDTTIKYNLKDILPKGVVIYGEVYGDGIQKGYSYGCKEGERNLIVFDVMVDGKYLDVDDASKICEELKLPFVIEVYRGNFDINKIRKVAHGSSLLCSSQKVREGVVIKPIKEERSFMGRKIAKVINPDYYFQNTTEFH